MFNPRILLQLTLFLWAWDSYLCIDEAVLVAALANAVPVADKKMLWEGSTVG